jgi:hypothetical protein
MGIVDGYPVHGHQWADALLSPDRERSGKVPGGPTKSMSKPSVSLANRYVMRAGAVFAVRPLPFAAEKNIFDTAACSCILTQRSNFMGWQYSNFSNLTNLARWLYVCGPCGMGFAILTEVDSIVSGDHD